MKVRKAWRKGQKRFGYSVSLSPPPLPTFLSRLIFKDPKDTPPPTRIETKEERKERKRKERVEQIAYKLEQDLALWDPHNIPDSTSDPYKTLFVARINYDTSESKLRREFEVFGPIRRIRMVNDVKSVKMRGYAFIEYEHERDMHSAYKHADGRKIDGRRVLVDVERGRTVKGWRPRRLGGGLGGTRKGGPEENTRFSGRDEFNPGRDGYRDERTGRERSRSRERDRAGGAGGGAGIGGSGGGAGRRRSRSRERRRSRSRERGGRLRSRSRDRRRSRDREEKVSEGEEDIRIKERKRRRSRSRDRRRSRSRERKSRGSRRSRSRERRRSRERGRAGEKLEPNAESVPPPPVPAYDDEAMIHREIKQEPIDPGYDIHPNYSQMGMAGVPSEQNAHYMSNGGQGPSPSNTQSLPPDHPLEDRYEDYNED
ncbi:small nuclear ribonucleoprotein 70 kDa-like [Octopus vulgaris]|uniref:Small nuclear ribonucleoprotein 70 kDa-like n=2 Tax=Octopus TaxID=6643 RepID=A0AA36F3D0_OCTVU|nr:U1 small nuclear ribonucleoprotein 70 kDa isoform X2 [Octopus sinensis]CAI9722330.1 small nuclear ribonucleoprotein 70 kDa-like [Octopus vulgaris]